MYYIDSQKFREKNSSGAVIAKIDDIKKHFKNPLGGHSLVTFWIAFIR